MSSKGTAFDGESSKIYNKISDQHRHKDGPWMAMLNKVKSFDLPIDGKIVDVASGPGEPAVTLASNLQQNITVFSTDVSPDMHKLAAIKAIQIPNLKAMIADAVDLSAFESNSIDVVTCCYGYMFPEDKVKALSETYRILKPGGKLVATYWINLDFLKVAGDMMLAVTGIESPPPPQNPMSLSEPNLFSSIAQSGGFNIDTLEYVESVYPFHLGTDKDFQYKVSTLLIKHKLDELNCHEQAKELFDAVAQKYCVQDDTTGELIILNNVFAMATLTK